MVEEYREKVLSGPLIYIYTCLKEKEKLSMIHIHLFLKIGLDNDYHTF